MYIYTVHSEYKSFPNVYQNHYKQGANPNIDYNHKTHIFWVFHVRFSLLYLAIFLYFITLLLLLRNSQYISLHRQNFSFSLR